MGFTRHIPNIFTLLNLLCGVFALMSILQFNNYVFASVLVLIAMVCDFLDGFMARAFGVSGELGKQLDSLADMVTFGVVPAVLVYAILHRLMPSFEMLQQRPFLIYVPLFMALMSAIRLAKFNIDTNQSNQFIGLPTPANALFWIAIPLILFTTEEGEFTQSEPLVIQDSFWTMLIHPWVLVIGTVGFGLLMVSKIPMLALKFKGFGFRGNEFRYALIVVSVLTIALTYFIWSNLFAALPIVILLYFLFSIASNVLNKDEIQSRN